jgi:hypothetical protein
MFDEKPTCHDRKVHLTRPRSILGSRGCSRCIFALRYTVTCRVLVLSQTTLVSACLVTDRASQSRNIHTIVDRSAGGVQSEEMDLEQARRRLTKHEQPRVRPIRCPSVFPFPSRTRTCHRKASRRRAQLLVLYHRKKCLVSWVQTWRTKTLHQQQ